MTHSLPVGLDSLPETTSDPPRVAGVAGPTIRFLVAHFVTSSASVARLVQGIGETSWVLVGLG